MVRMVHPCERMVGNNLDCACVEWFRSVHLGVPVPDSDYLRVQPGIMKERKKKSAI